MHLNELAGMGGFVAKGNYGFGFGGTARRLRGRRRTSERKTDNRYNPTQRTKGLRWWSPERWEAYCAAVPRGRR